MSVGVAGILQPWFYIEGHLCRRTPLSKDAMTGKLKWAQLDLHDASVSAGLDVLLNYFNALRLQFSDAKAGVLPQTFHKTLMPPGMAYCKGGVSKLADRGLAVITPSRWTPPLDYMFPARHVFIVFWRYMIPARHVFIVFWHYMIPAIRTLIVSVTARMTNSSANPLSARRSTHFL